MPQSTHSFFSCLESRTEESGEMYGRFYLGKFARGQALTLVNPLRRVLLGEMPSLAIASVQIAGVTHEFSILDGVQESVLDLILNLKGLVFALADPHKSFLETGKVAFTAYINTAGPKRVTGSSIKLPEGLVCVNPDHYLATITLASRLQIRFHLSLINQRTKTTQDLLNNEILKSPVGVDSEDIKNQFAQKTFFLDIFPAPVRRVNYVIQDLDPVTETESITLEVWTDGSLQPHQAIEFAFSQLTNQFYMFSQLSRNIARAPHT